MDGALLQTKVYAGFAKAAQRVGLTYDIYRPTSANNPISVGNKILTLPAAFAVHGPANFNFTVPSDYQKPLFHALVDAAQIRVGDYLNNPANTFGPFFIAAMEPFKPVLAVQTNRTLTFYTPGVQGAPIGASGYGGTTAANETAFMTAWPASVLLGARGVRDQVLPEDAGYGSWRILVPAWTGAVIRSGTVIRDDIANRYIVQSAELQDFGWRIDAQQAVT